MSRIAKNPIAIPKGVEVSLSGNEIRIKGPKGELRSAKNSSIDLVFENELIVVKGGRQDKAINSLAGTTRALIANMVHGVSIGYEKKLNLVGVGYRAQAKGEILSLSLGYSHPVDFKVPVGITVETPSQTEIVIKGCDKQCVGQVAANVRAYRQPEPYKGKGIRYSDEIITRKEAKKK